MQPTPWTPAPAIVQDDPTTPGFERSTNITSRPPARARGPYPTRRPPAPAPAPPAAPATYDTPALPPASARITLPLPNVWQGATIVQTAQLILNPGPLPSAPPPSCLPASAGPI